MQASQERFGPAPRFLCLSQHEDVTGVFKVSTADVTQIVVQMVGSPVTAVEKDDPASLYSYTEGQIKENSVKTSSAALSEVQLLLQRISGK